MTDSSPGLLYDGMAAIEAELIGFKNAWSDAEDALVRKTAAVEKLKAPQRLQFKTNPQPGLEKATKEDLDALLLDWLWREHEPLMVELINAEAKCVAYQTKERVAAKALSSMQTRLNADLKLMTGPSRS